MHYPAPGQPLAIKLINRVGRYLAKLGWAGPTLAPEQLIKKVQRRTGLNDLGGGGYDVALAALTESLQSEAKLSLIGRIAAQNILLEQLEARLQLIDYRKQRPEVAEQKITRPLFILGLPRTGTTILYELLAQDPAHRAPMSWEVAKPMPPAQADNFTSDPRIEEIEKALGKTEMLSPGFKSIHEIGANLPQECIAILASSFFSDMYGASFNIPSYRRWLTAQDMSEAYRWHYHFLQHLQVDYSCERWVLKTPPHLAFLEALVAQYPDAAIVQTHRDPMEVMGSTASLSCTLHGAFSDDIDPVETGQHEVHYFAQMLNRGMAQRDAMPDSSRRFFDIRFSDLVSDPISVIKQLYQHFDFEFTDAAETAMRTYFENRPRDKHGKHSYQLEDFGLSRECHSPLFADYCQRYGF